MIRRSFSALLAAVLCAALAPTVAFGIAPSPALLQQAKSDPALASRIAGATKAAKAKGIDAPVVDRVVVTKDAAGAPVVTVAKAPGASGQLRTLAILVEFSDHAGQVAPASFDSLLFDDVVGPASLRGYYREVSYDTLSVTTADAPSSVGWVALPHTASYYAGNPNENGMGTFPHNSQGMVTDAVAAVDAAVDFSQYDNDDDGYVDNLLVIHAGKGAEYSGSATDIWSHAWGLSSPVLVDGVRVDAYSTEPEYWKNPGDMTVGVYAHEVGHVLGLPDLYDYDGSSEGVGEWSLMAGGSWNGASSTGGDSPARMDAWSSAQLGWLQPVTVTSAPSVKSLPTVGSSATGTAYKVYPNGASSGPEYFLVENRQKTGTDSYLPGDGLLVWHVDETQLAGDVNDNEAHKAVDLEEADGIADMDNAENRGTAGDAFPGTSDNRAFTASSNPNSRTYLGADSLVSVDQISASQATMSARIGVGIAGTLGGTVSDSGGALPGVTVSVPGYEPATTGATGSYSITGVAPGDYSVTYSKSGYTSQILSVTISAGGTTTRNVTMVLGENDDDIPGVAAPASPIADTLDENADPHDVFRIHLTAGQVLSLSMNGAAGTDFDMRLFGPDAQHIAEDASVASAQGSSYPDDLSYAVSATGDYYICADAFSGSGPYTIAYSVATVGGLAGTVSGPSGVLEGVTVEVDGFAPTTTAADGAYSVAGIAPGTYDVAYSKSGYRSTWRSVTINSGTTTFENVTLSASEADDDIPGVAAPASPITSSLDDSDDVTDVFKIYLGAGDTLDVTMTGSTGTDFDLYLFAPAAQSVWDDAAIEYSENTEYPEHFKFTAPAAGNYYLCAYGYDGSGTYSIAYTKTTPTVYKPVYRFRNLRSGYYLWSADESEKAYIITNLSSTWKYEGVAYRINVANTTNRSPLWRFVNIRGGYYLYSADANEKAAIIANLSSTWRYEGPAYSVSTNRSGAPVWRFRNKANGTYLYSSDVNEKNNIVANLSATWQLEGPAYYLAP